MNVYKILTNISLLIGEVNLTNLYILSNNSTISYTIKKDMKEKTEEETESDN